MSDYPERKRSHLEDGNNRLYGVPLKEGAGAPTFLLYYSNNTAKIDVWSNLDGDKDGGRNSISVPESKLCDFLATLELVISKKDSKDFSITVDLFEKKWDNNAKAFSKEPKLDARLAVGRDKEGRIFISLISWDKQRAIIPFYFGINQYRKFTAKGITLSDAEISEIAANGFLMYNKMHRPAVVADQYVYKTKNKDSDKGNDKQSRGYQASTKYEDDDFPF